MLGGSITMGGANPLASSAVTDLLDDIIFKAGNDGDIAYVLRSTTLTANTTLTDVLEGTPVTPALAANSLIISNATNDGDILIAGSDGGNSKASLFFDSSAGDTYLYHVGGTWTAGGSTWTIPAVTLGGTVAAGGNDITGLGNLELDAGSKISIDSTALSSLDIKTPSADAAGGIILRRSTDDSAFAIYEKSNCLEVAFANNASGADAVGDFTTIWRMSPTGSIDFYETAYPDVGGANTARVYAFEGAGDGLTDLCAVFQDGTIDVFAEEATSLDSPRFTTPSGTPMSVKLRKDHPGLVSVVAVFPDGQEMPLKHFEYHDADKVAANVGCDNPLPADWLVETAEEREAKVLAFENGG